MEIEFDAEKALANLRKHQVRFADAELALQDPLALTIEDPDAVEEQRFVSLGMAFNGQVLVVVYTQRADRIRLISARKASKGEARQYHAQGI